jgi:hypothetical protein
MALRGAVVARKGGAYCVFEPSSLPLMGQDFYNLNEDKLRVDIKCFCYVRIDT